MVNGGLIFEVQIRTPILTPFRYTQSSFSAFVGKFFSGLICFLDTSKLSVASDEAGVTFRLQFHDLADGGNRVLVALRQILRES